jgi:hypothetical protein
MEESLPVHNESTSPGIARTGFLSGMVAFIAATSYVVVQILQVANMIPYPWDEILIYATSLCIVIPFILEMLALHYLTTGDKKFWSHAALIFSILYAVFVTANYVVQLATVIPMTLEGRTDIAILRQTPHSLFWDFDALGYIFMGVAMLFAVPVFQGHGFEGWVRIAFIANAAVTPLIAIVYFYPVYSAKLLVLGFPWGITAPCAMLFLALLFKRKVTPKKI